VPRKDDSEIVVCISDTSVGSLCNCYKTVLCDDRISVAISSSLFHRCQIWLLHSGKHTSWQNYFKL